MRVVVDNKYTFEAIGNVKVGDRVLLPTPYWLRDVKGPTWEGTVTSLNSNYTGDCASIISIIDYEKRKEKENSVKTAQVKRTRRVNRVRRSKQDSP